MPSLMAPAWPLMPPPDTLASRVELAQHVAYGQGLADLDTGRLTDEIVLEVAIVDPHLAGPLTQPHSGGRVLATSGAEKI